jgi:probable O-glycosylation ligase (exosortase A-associated)
MRDLIVVLLVITAAGAALRHPWVGVILWNWVSIMNPHRYTYGFAFSFPVAQVAAIATVVGLALTKDQRSSPFKGAPMVMLAMFTVWMTISWAFGLSPADDYPQWDKVMKVYFMIFIGMMVMHSKSHIIALVWVCAGSLGLLGLKGGLYTLASGGSGRVWGPPGTFIEDNNEFGLSLVVTIPLLRFLQMQVKSPWGKHTLTLMMVLCAAAALGTQSRGALLAISAMTLLLWWRGKSRVLGGALIALAAVLLVAFMPESWEARMSTIKTYEADGSAMGRISAWWTAWGVALDYPLGAGFNVARPELFAKYSPFGGQHVHAAHSIYFQILGNHGFVGLFLWLSIWIGVWVIANWLRKQEQGRPELKWCSELGSMCQVSLIGFAVGGAFLSLAYWDMPYNIMMMVLLTRAWVRSKGWEREPEVVPRWWSLPGMLPSSVTKR